jgi:pyridoxamine 5'-phosphate oxidase
MATSLGREPSVGELRLMNPPDYAVRAHEHPAAWLERWLQEADESGELNHNAMALSTLNASGAPRTRFVLCKGVNETGLRFFTNLESDKGIELARDNRVSVAFYWSILRRQVRVEGTVSLLPDEDADAYFRSRDRLSNVGAWASQQSRPVANREALEAEVETISKRFADEVPRPPHWTGFHLKADSWEFWQDQPGRIHDRWVLKPDADDWLMWRLQP